MPRFILTTHTSRSTMRLRSSISGNSFQTSIRSREESSSSADVAVNGKKFLQCFLRRILAEREIRTLDTGVSPYNGLANETVLGPVVRIQRYTAETIGDFWPEILLFGSSCAACVHDADTSTQVRTYPCTSKPLLSTWCRPLGVISRKPALDRFRVADSSRRAHSCRIEGRT